MKSTRLICLLCLVIFTAGCVPSAATPPNPASTATAAPTEPAAPLPTAEITPATPTILPEPTAQARPLSAYTLAALLDYDQHTLAVDGKLSYINNSPEALSELLLLVEPNRTAGVFTLESLSLHGERVASYSLQGAELRLPMPEPLAPGATAEIAFTYTLRLPQVDAPFGYGARQTNLADWYPFAPPYLAGQGWLVREDAFYGEHLAYEVAAFDVRLQLAQPANAEGFPLVIAAPAEAGMEGEVYHYQHAPARGFSFSVSHLYQVLEQQVGETTVYSYSFPYHAEADAAALDAASKALELYSRLFSPYPHKVFSVVEGEFLDGMEYDGLVYLSHAFYDYHTGNVQGNLTIIAAHEVAHQWWFGLVANDQAMEPWLDEALSTYSELLFYENVYPEMAQWWLDNRIAFHNPQGWVDISIYQVGGFYPYRDAVYLRGGQFLLELRGLMGEEAFAAFLKEYLQTFTYGIASADDFFALLSEHSSADLTSLLDRYFEKR